MSKLWESDIFLKHLEKHTDKINLSEPKYRSFIERVTGAILEMTPMSICFMIEEGLPEDEKAAYIAMSVIGRTMAEVGEINLQMLLEKQGEDNENTNLKLVANGSGRVLN